MDKKINLSQLADLVAQAGGMSKTASEQFVKSFFDIIAQGVLADGMVKVKGLGTFKLLQMEDRESVNVNTGERFTIEGHQKISFTPDAELKDRINKPFAAFETVEITPEQAAELAKIDEVAATETAAEATADETAPAVEETIPEPAVKDVTQKGFTRFILKFFVWILSIALVLALLLYLFWPLVGCKLLGVIDEKLNNDKQTEITTAPKDSLIINEAPQQPAKSIAPAKPVEPSKPAEPTKPVTPAKPAEPAKPAVTPAKPAAVTTENTAVAQQFKLNAADTAKDLAQFTDADTVNYRIAGELTVHTMQSGETLTKLALKYYGSKKLWPYIAKYNKYGKSYNNLKAGDKIRIPKLEGK